MNYYKGCAIGLILLSSLITANKAETQDQYINQNYQVLAMIDAYAQELPSTDMVQKKLRKKIRKRIDTMKIWQLTEMFDLSDDAWRKFFKVMKDYEGKNNKLAMQRVEVKHKLRKAIEEDKNDGISDLLKKLGELSRRGIEIEQKELEEMKEILSIKQLAKYALFRENFDHHINRIISKCKKVSFDKDRHSPPPK